MILVKISGFMKLLGLFIDSNPKRISYKSPYHTGLDSSPEPFPPLFINYPFPTLKKSTIPKIFILHI